MLRYLIRRPVAVTMVIIALVTVGIFAVRTIPISLMPDIDIPQITVQVDMPGYSALEMEEKVVAPLRGQLARVSGLKSLRSDARMDAGTLLLKFEPGSDIGLLFIDVNEKVDMAMGSMPKEMSRPRVIKASATDIPAFYIDISFRHERRGERASARFSQLSDFARNVVSRRIEQLPSTAMVDISGLTSSEIVCMPDEEKMLSLGITQRELQTTLAAHDIQLEALSVTDGLYRYNVHFDSQILTIDDVRHVYLNHDGRLLQLQDLCRIEERPAQRKGILRHDGKNCVTLAVIKQSDCQMDDLREAVDGVLSDLRAAYPDISFDVTRDQTELLAYSIGNLEWNLVAAAFFTLLVLLYFMRNWRMALLVALSIPLSLLMTLLCFRLLGISLNIISLSGLILGVGMIVDNSIIVIDNVMQKLRAGQTLSDAVCQGASEVFTAMLSSVLTTCSVFVPLVFISGMAGALFYDQSMGVTLALFASLIVAMVVLPVYFCVLYKKVHARPASPSRYGSRHSSWTQHGHRPIFRWYERTQAWMFRHARLCIALFCLAVPGIVLLFFAADKRQLPTLDYSDAILHIDWNAGISVEENDRRLCELMDRHTKDIEATTTMAGMQDFLLSHTRDITSSEALVYFKCPSVAAFHAVCDSIASDLHRRYPDASLTFSPSGNLFDLIFSSDEPDLEILVQSREGHRPKVSQAEAFTDTLRSHFPRMAIPSVVTEEHLELVADIEQMTVYKISYDQLRSRLTDMLGHNKVLQINQGAGSVPVLMGASTSDRRAIMGGTITNADGVSVPLSYLLRERLVNGYKHVYGSEGGDFHPIRIMASARDVRELMAFVDSYARQHDDLSFSYSGGYFSSRQLVAQLVWVLGVSLLLLFFVLAAQFESLVQPCIILSEIVVDVFMVTLVLWLLGESLNVMSMTGMVVMCGIVINDSILKIDTINQHRRRGLTLLRAIVLAGHERLMPIIMTSLTTLLSLLPFLSRGSIGADMQYPLSLAIMVGMVVGTLVSIFFVPLVYYFIFHGRQPVRRPSV